MVKWFWWKQLTSGADKHTTCRDGSSMTLPSVTDATPIVHNSDSSVSAQCIQKLHTPPDTTQDVEDEFAADGESADQATISFVVDPNPSYERLDDTSVEDELEQASSPDEEEMAIQPCLERVQDLTEQNPDGQFAKPGSATSPHAGSCGVDAKSTTRTNSGETGHELVAVTSSTKDGDASTEQMCAEQLIDRAAALQMDTALEAALEIPTNARYQEHVTELYHRSQSSQIEMMPEANGELERTGRVVPLPKIGDFLYESDRNIPQEQESGPNTSLHTEAAQQSQCEKPSSKNGAEPMQDKQTSRPKRDGIDMEEQESAHVQSSPGQNLAVEAQNLPTKPTAIVQDDDTDYLHAFLTRAKAKKAAREASPQKVDRVPPSPMTRSRAALVQLSTNSLSPRKPAKPQLDTPDELEVLDTNRAGSPCRRSGRTRLPRPQKAPIVTPNTIPVRRSNGTEFVFLQNTDTAQVALATRTNTKRNKGEAVAPKMKLQALSLAPKSPSKSPRPRRGREVSWKEEATYFGTQADDAEEAEEKLKADERPRTRKVRRLGAANGTPAPKKMMTVGTMDVGTPVSRRRGKVKG